MLFRVSFLHSQISFVDIVLQVSFAKILSKGTNEIQIGDLDSMQLQMQQAVVSRAQEYMSLLFQWSGIRRLLFNTPPHKRCTPPPTLTRAKERSFVGLVQTPHSMLSH